MGSFCCSSAPCCGTPPSAIGCQQAAAASEKDGRSAAEQKINVQLLHEIYRRRGEAEQRGVLPGPSGIEIDTRGRALVDVRANVTTALEKSIRTLGGTIVSTSSEHRSIIARVPLLALDRLANEPTVTFIEPAAEARTTRSPRR
jgi:hypothetical protein